MTPCDRCRQEMLVRPAHALAELDHLRGCPSCRALAASITEQEANMYQQLTDWVEAPRPATRPRSRSLGWPIVALAAAAVAAVWVATLGPTEPIPPDAGPGGAFGAAAAPTRAPAPAPVAPVDALTLERGASLVIRLPHAATTVALDPPGIAEATLLDPAREVLMVVGQQEGDAVLRIALDGTPKPLAYAIEVGGARTEVPADEASVEVEIGHAVPVVLRGEPVAIRTSDPAIATAARVEGRREVSVSGARAGIVDLVVLYGEGPPDVWVVRVR